MISPLAYVDPAAKLGLNVKIHPFAYIDADTVIGDECEIMPYASIIGGTTLGKNVKVYQGAIVGADPQDFRWKGEKSLCSIGDNTIIREHVIINRGIHAGSETRIGADCFIFADSHIGHDSQIEDKCVIGNGVTIAGDVAIGTGTILSSTVMIHEGCHVGKLVLLKGGTRISSNVPPYVIMAHNPVTYYGVNSIVMRKHAGFTEQQIDDIAKAYRHIYQCSTSLFNALRRIEDDIEPSEVREEILGFVRENNLQLAGDRFIGD
ncbi:MAG: acyl-ACP--UDP-N-acetylglucosamine O-acyltransferase [Muribaculaceae bacterium]|nr:acyl-ACP--UDP-N-acetylglucosamine O-acyltransferase [Muribaculaceae bacterium]